MHATSAQAWTITSPERGAPAPSSATMPLTVLPAGRPIARPLVPAVTLRAPAEAGEIPDAAR